MLVNLEGEDEMFQLVFLFVIINVFLLVRLSGIRVIFEILFIVSVFVLGNVSVGGKFFVIIFMVIVDELFESVLGFGELVSLIVINEVEVFFYEVSG